MFKERKHICFGVGLFFCLSWILDDDYFFFNKEHMLFKLQLLDVLFFGRLSTEAWLFFFFLCIFGVSNKQDVF